MRLDEERLAGRSPGARRPPLSRDYVNQNFDLYSVEYTFADGTKFIMDGRCMGGCDDIYSSYAHGTKGTAIISRSGDCGGPSAIFKGLAFDDKSIAWKAKNKRGEDNPYRNEWNDLVSAVRNDKPYNEVKRGVEASLVTSMGRMAAHTGKVITFDEMLNGKIEYAPGVDRFTLDGPAPIMSDAHGLYPIPKPGIVTDREYS